MAHLSSRNRFLTAESSFYFLTLLDMQWLVLVMRFCIKVFIFFLWITKIYGQEQSISEPQPTKKTVHMALPEGQTLPENVWRIRSIHKYAQGQLGFDKYGHKSKQGISIFAHGSGSVFEYGITNRLTIQLLIPYVHTNRAGLDAQDFRKSDLYKIKYDKAMQLIITKLEENSLCKGASQCLALIRSGFTLPAAKSFSLPTGEVITISHTDQIATYLDRLVTNASKQSEGSHGLGDIETGMLLNLFRDENFSSSFGLGFRWPSGSFYKVPAGMRPSGGGFYETGVRLNLDYQPVAGLWLSYQEQLEWALTNAKRKRSSLINPQYLNSFNASTSNEQVYQKHGIKRISLLKANIGLGVISPALKSLGTFTSYQFEEEAKITVDKESLKSPARLHYASIGAYIDGRGYDLPVGLDIEQKVPVAGKNAVVATDMTLITLKAYARF